MTDQPWLSIITVVKDAPVDFARTLESLRTQNLVGVQYLVIDSSADSALIPTTLEQSGISFSYQWCEPAGIYAAMNIGLNQATGTYVYFLNAGDELLPEVLSQVLAASTECTTPWLIGQVEVESITGARVTTPEWNFAAEKNALFARGIFAPHQGTFARTDALRTAGGFNENFRIAADYAAFLKLTLLSTPVMLPLTIARFYEGGLSTQKWQDSFKEFHQARISILAPQGMQAVAERFYTARQFMAVGLYRGIWSKIVKP
jgi:glycosyltransferase involved in cell wall biosynthesis